MQYTLAHFLIFLKLVTYTTSVLCADDTSKILSVQDASQELHKLSLCYTCVNQALTQTTKLPINQIKEMCYTPKNNTCKKGHAPFGKSAKEKLTQCQQTCASILNTPQFKHNPKRHILECHTQKVVLGHISKNKSSTLINTNNHSPARVKAYALSGVFFCYGCFDKKVETSPNGKISLTDFNTLTRYPDKKSVRDHMKTEHKYSGSKFIGLLNYCKRKCNLTDHYLFKNTRMHLASHINISKLNNHSNTHEIEKNYIEEDDAETDLEEIPDNVITESDDSMTESDNEL